MIRTFLHRMLLSIFGILLLSVLFTLSALSQEFRIIHYDETVMRGGFNWRENGIHRDIRITQHCLYGPYDEDYEKLWTAPNGLSIVDVFNKGEVFHGDVVLIVLSDATIWKMHMVRPYYKWSTPEFAGNLTKANYSESITKLLGDDLYMLTSSFVYVSRDTVSSWEIDSAGIGNQRIWSIAQDSEQYVYAATPTGLYKQAPDSSIWRRITTYTGSQNTYNIFVDGRNRLLLGLNGGGIYISTDRGDSWTIDTAGVGQTSVNFFAGDVYGNLFFVNSNGIYRSIGGTQPWTRIDDGINAITFNHPAIYALIGDSTLTALTSLGQFISSDHGTSWTELHNTASADNALGVVRADNGDVIVAGERGIYRVPFGSSTSTKVFPVDGYQSGISLYGRSSTGMFIIVPDPHSNSSSIGKIFKSTDAGLTWLPDTAGISTTIGGPYFVDEHGTQHLASGFWSSSVYCTLYKNEGTGWVVDTAGFPSHNYNFGTSFTSDNSGFLYASGYFGGVQVYRRPIAGGVWVADTAGLQGISYFYQMINDGAGSIIGKTGSGIFHRASSAWVPIALPSQLVYPGISAISADSTGTLVVAFTSYDYLSNRPLGVGVYCTTDFGTTWTHMVGGDSVYVTQLAAYGDTTYVVSDHGIVLLTKTVPPAVLSVQDSLEAGWNLVSVPFVRHDYAAASLFPSRIAGSTFEYRKGYVGRDSLTLGRGYWTKFPAQSLDTLSGSALATASVTVDSGWNIIGSVDHVTPVPTGSIIASNIYGYAHGYAMASELVPGKGYWVKASASGSIMLGTSATLKSTANLLESMNSIAITDAAQSSQTLYFGDAQDASPDQFEMPPPPPAGMFDARYSSGRILESAKPGNTNVVKVSLSSPVYPVRLSWHCNATRPGSDTLVVGNRRIPMKSDGTAGLSGDAENISIILAPGSTTRAPLTFHLDQAYPNPFNPSTNISYSIPTDTRVTLTVYNVLGQEIARLVDAPQKSGEYQVRFDGAGHPSGLYFYSLHAGEKADTKKFMIIK